MHVTFIANLLLAAWVGAAALFTTVVAPAAFAMLPARALAGALVGRILPVVFVSGLVVALAAFALDWPYARTAVARWRGGALIVAMIANATAQFLVGPRIQQLRAEMGPVIEALAVDDPKRRAFGLLHAISVGWLGLAIVATLVALTAHALAARSAAAASTP
ncbi:MAG: DUF4149 domain-containing protein [Gemmatimonadetes bacterium]|nr:DUF4149 domain-containing protein [Gemmatimonadota bacterium]